MTNIIPTVEDHYAAIALAAQKIEDETLRANALNLVERMRTVIEGIGDRPIRWSPGSLRLVQAMTDTDKVPDSCKKGDIYLGGTAFGKSADVIPLMSWHSRSYWNPDLSQSSKKICQSPDGVVGWKFGNCKGCEHSKWVDNTPSNCKSEITVLCITPDFSEIFFIVFSKTGYKEGQAFEQLLQKAKVHAFRNQYQINSIQNAGNKNVFNMHATAGTPVTGEDKLEFLRTVFTHFSNDRRAFIEAFHQKRREYEAAQAAQGGSTGVIGVDSGHYIGDDTTTVIIGADNTATPVAQESQEATRYSM